MRLNRNEIALKTWFYFFVYFFIFVRNLFSAKSSSMSVLVFFILFISVKEISDFKPKEIQTTSTLEKFIRLYTALQSGSCS